MDMQSKVAAVVIGWLAAIVTMIVLGILVHTFFLGVAAGSILTAIVLRYAVEWAAKNIAQQASDHADQMLDELEQMQEDVEG